MNAPRSLVLLGALLAGACNPPPPAGRWVDSDKAATLVLSVYLGRQPSPSELPRVHIVKAEPRCKDAVGGPGTYGFWDVDRCKGGVTINERDVFIVEPPRGNWSDNDMLVHELLHSAGRNHEGAATWAAGSSEAQLIQIAWAVLIASPEIDRVSK